MVDKTRTTITVLETNDKLAEVSAESVAMNGSMEEIPNTLQKLESA